MAARLLALAVLAASAAPGLAAAAAVADGGTGLPDLLSQLGVPAPRDLPGPLVPPGPDTPPGGSGNAPVPVAPDLVAPSARQDASLLVAGFAGALGMVGFALWGVTRFRSTEEVLQHELRSKIYRYVEEHVGASLKDITEALGLSTTNAVWHLRKLEEGGLVRGRKFNGAKVYYPTAGGVQARNLSIAGAALTNANARTILGFVQEHPGVHQREVARLLNVNHGTVRWHLKKLRRAELLEERRTGASASYHVTPLGAEALRVVQARAANAVPAQAPGSGVAQDSPMPPAAGRA